MLSPWCPSFPILWALVWTFYTSGMSSGIWVTCTLTTPLWQHVYPFRDTDDNLVIVLYSTLVFLTEALYQDVCTKSQSCVYVLCRCGPSTSWTDGQIPWKKDRHLSPPSASFSHSTEGSRKLTLLPHKPLPGSGHRKHLVKMRRNVPPWRKWYTRPTMGRSKLLCCGLIALVTQQISLSLHKLVTRTRPLYSVLLLQRAYSTGEKWSRMSLRFLVYFWTQTRQTDLVPLEKDQSYG